MGFGEQEREEEKEERKNKMHVFLLCALSQQNTRKKNKGTNTHIHTQRQCVLEWGIYPVFPVGRSCPFVPHCVLCPFESLTPSFVTNLLDPEYMHAQKKNTSTKKQQGSTQPRTKESPSLALCAPGDHSRDVHIHLLIPARCAKVKQGSCPYALPTSNSQSWLLFAINTPILCPAPKQRAKNGLGEDPYLFAVKISEDK